MHYSRECWCRREKESVKCPDRWLKRKKRRMINESLTQSSHLVLCPYFESRLAYYSLTLFLSVERVREWLQLATERSSGAFSREKRYFHQQHWAQQFADEMICFTSSPLIIQWPVHCTIMWTGSESSNLVEKEKLHWCTCCRQRFPLILLILSECFLFVSLSHSFIVTWCGWFRQTNALLSLRRSSCS